MADVTEQIDESIEQDDEAKRRARGDFVDEESKDEESKDEDVDADALAAVVGDDGEAVPYHRFNKIAKAFREEQEARLRLEGENAALREVAKAAPTQEAKSVEKVDVRALRKQASDALLEGDSAKATELNAQADAALLEQGATIGTERAIARIRAEAMQERLDDAAERMAEKYPFLDSTSAEADKAAIAEVVEWRDFYMSKGMPAHRALERAATKIGEPLRKGQTKAEGGETPDDLARRREALALSRAGDAARRQPAPITGGKGERASKAEAPDDVAKLTDAQFKSMPAAEKARLRGDVV